jgi:hypothetical protein
MKSAYAPATIDLDVPSNIAYWTEKLKCTETQLQAAVLTVGTQVADVTKQLDYILTPGVKR